MRASFRGFDNMIGEEGSTTRTFIQKMKCITNATGATETQQFNITVDMAKSTPPTAALVPPSSIPVGCLVEDKETVVHAKFEAPNASASYRPLTGAWNMGDDLPWVFSRPMSAVRTSSDSQQTWDAGSQPILMKVRATSDGHSLELVLKPPADGTQGCLGGSA